VLIHHNLRRAAERWPTEVALVAGARRATFAELWESSGRLASALRARGVERGDRVAVFCPSGFEAAVASFAALRAGAVLLPINPQTRTRKLSYVLGDAEPRALIADGTLARIWLPALPAKDSDHGLRALVVAGASLPGGLDRPAVTLADALAETPAEAPDAPGLINQDLAAIIYTSGSTGDPKGVMLSHLNMVSALESVCQYLPIEKGDVIASALSLAYSYGLYQLLHAARVGARLLLLPSFAFPMQVLEEMVRERTTVFPGVPTFFSTLAALEGVSRFDLSTVRIVTSAAAPLAPTQVKEARGLFPHALFYCMYGLTECKRVTYLPPEDIDRRLGSVGKGMPNQELYLVDEEGQRLPPGSTGELVVRGAHVMRGYWRKPRETAERLRPGPLPGENVLHTGDLFHMAEDGYLTFVARKDDIIKVRGEKVSPREVENVVLQLPSVLEAVVLGVDDALAGQAVKVFVVPRPGQTCTPDEIVRHCRAQLEATHVPKHVEIVAELPRNNSGKIDKRALRGQAPDESEDVRA
jgi:amino acid adenylation domain-containing protein